MANLESASPTLASQGGSPAGAGAAELPVISIVIPVRNEEADLPNLLRDLITQRYPADHFEILVVDGGSTDRTPEIVKSYFKDHSSINNLISKDTIGPELPAVALLSNPGVLSSAGRNVGVRHSRGDLILFIDGHCRVPRGSFLLDTARILRETGAECLCRPQPLTAAANTRFQNVVAHARASYIGHGRGSTIYSINSEGFVDPTSSGAAYRRSVFGRVGMFDERFDACEDVEFNYRVHRAGIPSYLSHHLAITYRPRSSLRGLFKQAVRYGRGRFRFMGKHRAGATLAQLVPAIFVAGLAFGAIGSVVSPVVSEWLLIAVLSYMAVVLGFSVHLALRHGWQHLVLAPAVYLTIHLGFGFGFWAETGHFLSQHLHSFGKQDEVRRPAPDQKSADFGG